MPLSASEIKFIRSLQQKKFRKEHGLFVVEGVKPVSELVNSDLEIVDVYATEELSFYADAKSVSEKELSRISGFKSPNKVLAAARIPAINSIDWNSDIVLYLDEINDPGNLGTIIRTAKWFGVSEIVCSENCTDAYDRKVVQSTMGALFHIKVHYQNRASFLNTAKENEFNIVGTSMSGKSVYQSEFFDKTVLITGSESHGMSQQSESKCDQLVAIPNFENEQKVESLNAGIATSIILSEIRRRAKL